MHRDLPSPSTAESATRNARAYAVRYRHHSDSPKRYIRTRRVRSNLRRCSRRRLICLDGYAAVSLEVRENLATGGCLLVARRTTLAGCWHDGADANHSASVATGVWRGVADLSLSPSDQSRARDLVTRTCGTRPCFSATALAQHTRNDCVVRCGCAPFYVSHAHDIRAPSRGVTASRVGPPVGRTQPAAAAYPPCSDDPARVLPLWLRARL